MNIVNEGGGRGRGGTIYPRVKCPPLNPHVCFHFNVMIEGIEKSLVIWSFQNALQEDTGNGFSYLIPMNIVNEGGGGQGGNNLPQGKVPPPPTTTTPQSSYMLSFLCYDKGLIIWSFWMPFKNRLEAISPISSLWTLSIGGRGESILG